MMEKQKGVSHPQGGLVGVEEGEIGEPIALYRSIS